MPLVLCICDIAPRLALPTKVVVIAHCAEVRRPSNTSRVIPLVLPNSELRLRGLKDHPFEAEGLVPDNHTPLVLYPAPDAVELTAEFLAGVARPVVLVVPDGSWTQAPRIVRREPSLRSMKRVKLPGGPPSSFRLRTQPHEYTVSTFEAVARALGLIESPEVQRQLEWIFTVMVERRLWTRGKMKAGEVTGGIPTQAFEKPVAQGE